MRKNQKALKVLKSLDQTEKKISVIIDARTTIYVKEGTDPEEAKKKFLEKYNLYKIGIK